MTGEGAVEAALRVDLAGMGDLKGSALAALAVSLAQAIDRRDGRLPDLAGELRQVWTQLKELAPPTEVKDNLSDLRARRVARRGA